MKTLQEVIERDSNCMDGRDFARLGEFMTLEQLESIGLTPKKELKATWAPKAWKRETVLEQLTRDLGFAFEKALDKRGISADLMLEVVSMWVFALDDEGIRDFAFDDNYAQYGLPCLKAVALHYNLPNPLGDDAGTEEHYASN